MALNAEIENATMMALNTERKSDEDGSEHRY